MQSDVRARPTSRRLLCEVSKTALISIPGVHVTGGPMAKVDTVFSGSIPSLYDKYLGPLIFEPYAEDLASRLAALNPARVLETAAGTGIVTRALLRALPADTTIAAT